MESIKDITKRCIKTDKKIQILMSTYNGESYLREQLDSFLELEKFDEIKVLIRDDGSNDTTLEILEEYHNKYGFEVIKGKNLGVNESMKILFENADMNCDFFSISDQDDIWIRDKFKKALDLLEKENQKVPLLFSSCSEIVSEKLEHIGSTIIPMKNISFYNAISQNITPGHTQVFNRALMNKLLNIDTTDIHVIDWWIYLIATSLGKVIFICDFTVKHRQHGKNSVGYELNFLKKIINRIKALNKKDANSISRQLYSFRSHYKNELNSKYLKEIDNYFVSQRNILTRIKYVLKTPIYRQSKYETILFKILYIFGKYKLK